MYNFEYQRAASVADAAKAAKASDEAKLVAGGMTLLPTLKLRLATPSALIDLGAIKDLVGLKVAGGTVTIGAMTTHFAVSTSPDVQKAIPALAHLAAHIGDPAVRNRGTIGGSVSNNDPAADYPAGLLGLGATVITNERQIPADDFFKGMFETALKPGEIVTAVSFPAPEKAAYMKFPNPASRYAMVSVLVAKTKSGVRVAVTGAAPSVYRQKDMEAALGKSWSPDAVANIKQKADGLNSHTHASAQHLPHLVTPMPNRALPPP